MSAFYIMTEQLEQRTEAWFKARIGKITGSNIGAILGVCPFRKPNDVMRTMVRSAHGAESEFKGNIATEYGTKFESFALGDFELETGLNVIETGFHVSSENDFIGASPDGLINDDAVLEIKCPFGKRDSDDFKSILEQPQYYAQIQFEMYCTSRTKCYFYQWSVKGSKLEMVEFSQLWMDETIPKLKDFYNKYLAKVKEPDKYLLPLIQNKAAQSVADRYVKAKQDADKAKGELEQARKELIAIADGDKSNISGLLVYPISKSGSVSYSKIVKELLPDLDLTKYTGKSSSSWGIK